MCKYCEDVTRAHHQVEDFVPNGGNFLRYHRRSSCFSLFVVYNYDDGQANYVDADTVRFCPWCGRKLSYPIDKS